MRSNHPAEFRQDWVSYAGTGRNIFGGATLYGHGRPAHRIPPFPFSANFRGNPPIWVTRSRSSRFSGRILPTVIHATHASVFSRCRNRWVFLLAGDVNERHVWVAALAILSRVWNRPISDSSLSPLRSRERVG